MNREYKQAWLLLIGLISLIVIGVSCAIYGAFQSDAFVSNTMELFGTLLAILATVMLLPAVMLVVDARQEEGNHEENKVS